MLGCPLLSLHIKDILYTGYLLYIYFVRKYRKSDVPSINNLIKLIYSNRQTLKKEEKKKIHGSVGIIH